MNNPIHLEEKYEFNGWPSITRPDLKPPPGWNLSLISAVNRVRNHTLSPDGERIALIWDREDLSDIYLLESTGGWPQRVTTDRTAVPYWNDELPRWSPDGQWLAFTLNDHIHIAPRAGGLPQRISDFTIEASDPVWMPDSHKLIASVERFEATQLVLTDREGEWPRPLTEDPTGDAWDARPSPDGKFIAYTYRPFHDLNRLDIRLIDLESFAIHTLTNLPRVFNHSARWRPDSQQIAFLSQQSGFYEIWLISADGSNPHRLTYFVKDVIELAWAPDGVRLACIVNRNGAFELDLVDAATGKSSTLLGGPGMYSRPNWTPDGNFITFEYENPVQPPDLYRIELENCQVTQLTFSNLPALARLEMVMPETVSYISSNGLEVPAFLYLPGKTNGSGLLYAHGGPSDQNGYSWDIFVQYLVAKGYTVLAPNYRGSTGYGIEFERANHNDWGGGDTQDCLAGGSFLAGLPGISAERLAIFGGSYGGYLTNCCLARDPQYRFACGISKFGDANLLSSWAQCNRRLRLYTEIFLGHPGRNLDVYRRGSPVYEAQNVRKPLLILHGLLDTIVPPQASEEWVHALRQAGKVFEYKTYANEPHGFLQRVNLLDVWRRMERFLDWYLVP